MTVSIYVGNLSFSTEQSDLHTLFGNYGEVISANVISDRETGQSRGFGFVEMSSETAANTAISALNGSECDGRNLKVNVSQPKPQRNQGYGGRRY
ncbi:RNA-binding protein [Deltaproteobacteria bacterium Smac51]|nr:RNA-binding protein [Deltaproteobacteria bacterium Smac51]